MKKLDMKKAKKDRNGYFLGLKDEGIMDMTMLVIVILAIIFFLWAFWKGGN